MDHDLSTRMRPMIPGLLFAIVTLLVSVFIGLAFGANRTGVFQALLGRATPAAGAPQRTAGQSAEEGTGAARAPDAPQSSAEQRPEGASSAAGDEETPRPLPEGTQASPAALAQADGQGRAQGQRGGGQRRRGAGNPADLLISGHSHGGCMGGIAVVGILMMAMLGGPAALRRLTAGALGLGALGYTLYWTGAALMFRSAGSVDNAKAQLAWLAQSSAGIYVLGVLGMLAVTALGAAGKKDAP